jgi:hypothetical protein
MVLLVILAFAIITLLCALFAMLDMMRRLACVPVVIAILAC